MARKEPNVLIENARRVLREFWSDSETAPLDFSVIPDGIASAIDRCINSAMLTYRYVLPTQLLAKLTEPSLDCRVVQKGARRVGSFDARSLCHAVIVEFDRENQNVLGGSAEPYANNPIRIQVISKKYRAAQKDKTGFSDLIKVLDFVEGTPGTIREVFFLMLRSIRKRLEAVSIVYPVPNRVSLDQTERLLTIFLATRSGGTRLQSIAVALFREVGVRFQLFSLVRSGNVNSADSQTGIAADLECVDANDRVVMAVEVKDRTLTLHQLQDKLPTIRDKGIGELLFLVQGGVQSENADAVAKTIEREFVTGQNLYVCEFASFLQSCLILFGETGRRQFLQFVGEELDNLRADLAHRQDWSNLLRAL